MSNTNYIDIWLNMADEVTSNFKYCTVEQRLKQIYNL